MKVCSIFSTEEIKWQVRRILNYSLFRNSPVLSRFLEFIVNETLLNNESHIKEYAVAIHVLYRSRDFNPNGDSIVRIHAGRLRRALSDYYLTQGIYDPIIIRIPKGCYVPEFVGSGTSKPAEDLVPVLPAQRHKPVVAIFPLRVATQGEHIDELLQLLEGQLSEELLRFRDIAVIGYYSNDMKAKINENILEAGKSSGADYIITGSLAYMGEHMRVLVNLLVTATGEVLLCKSFDRNIATQDVAEIQADIIQNFIDFAGGCYRFIFQERQKHAC